MTKSQLSEALKLAKTDQEIEESIDIFYGFGIQGFTPVYVTIPQIAKLIRYQCFTFAGTIDDENFQEIANYGRSKFLVV